ncbi:MAG: tol-pal system protein YbgF [Deltaproteobacteria bacterium]|nr:tol-pal system protein YbgF [Deltaproteobacteria bacterium]
MNKRLAVLPLIAVITIMLLTGVAVASFEDNYQKGRILYLKKNYKKAAQTFSRLVLDYPEHNLTPDAIYWLAECYYALKDYREAAVQFERAADLAQNSPRAPDALLKKAYSLSRLGKYETAVSAFKSVLVRYPGTPAASRARENLCLLEKGGEKENIELPEIRAARAALGKKAIKAVAGHKTGGTESPGKTPQRRVKAAAGMSDIIGAIKHNDPATFKTILAKYPYVVEFRDREGRTPLHIAAAHNRIRMAGLLLAKGADVNADSGSYVFIYTPLHEAAKHNSVETAELLIANGAKVNAGRYVRRKDWADHYSFTPLHQAVRYHHVEMVKLLLENGADPNISAHPATGETPLRIARKNGYLKIAGILKDYLAVH